MPSSPSDSSEPSADQRLMTFLLLSVSILLLSQMMFGRRQPPPADPQAVEDAAEEGAGGGQPAEPANLAAASGDAAPGAEGDEAQAGDGAEPIEDAPEAPRQLVSLGTAEVDGPYRLLMTLDNRGAAVTRAELSAHEFRDLDDRSGYLGYLGLEEAESEGLRVTVVGDGTPAAEAGLKAGDVIVGCIYKKGVSKPDSRDAFRELLQSTKPGDALALQVVRGDEELSVNAALRRRPLTILRPESENIRLHNPKLAEGFIDVPSFVVTIAELNNQGAEDATVQAANEQLAAGTWEVAAADNRSVTFRKRLASVGLEFEKRFALVEVPTESRDDEAFPGYHFELDVKVRNLLATPQAVAYTLDGPNGLPIEGFWYANRIGRGKNGRGVWFGPVGIRDVVARYQNSSFIQYSCKNIVNGDVEPLENASMAYIGVDAQYFSVVLVPDKESLSEEWFEKAEARLASPELDADLALITYNNTTFSTTRKLISLEPAGGEGDSLDDGFRVFTGPKRPKLLEQYTPAGDSVYGLQNLLYYGWFAPVAQLMLSLLHIFYGVVRNYGVAIVMLTIVVRGCMFPVSRRQAQNMVKMQELKPEMDRINEKHKNDMEKRAKAQQELYRKHNFNPMGGCLPMFIQLPIFIGLYRALAVDIELRQAPLFGEAARFCSNLAAPDMLIDWSGIMPRWFNNGQFWGMLPGLGPYLNALPIVTLGLFLLQQKMFMPPPANEQAALQQKMMKYMMVIVGVMFFKVPSGLCLYFIASSLWGITERKMLPKPTPPAEPQGFSKPTPKPSTGNADAKKKAQQRSQAAKKKKKRR